VTANDQTDEADVRERSMERYARCGDRSEPGPTEYKRPKDGQQEDDTSSGEMQVPAEGWCRGGRQVPNGRGSSEDGTLRCDLCTGPERETGTAVMISTTLVVRLDVNLGLSLGQLVTGPTIDQCRDQDGSTHGSDDPLGVCETFSVSEHGSMVVQTQGRSITCIWECLHKDRRASRRARSVYSRSHDHVEDITAW